MPDEREEIYLPQDFASSLADLFLPPGGSPGDSPFFCDTPLCDGLPHAGFSENHARSPQQAQVMDPSLKWFIALFLAGRGSGKSRTGSEWLVENMFISPPNAYWAIVCGTFDDARDVAVAGESGVLSVLERRNIPYHFNKNLGILDLPHNSARCELYADTNPERLRGPNLSGAWCDEPSSFRRPLGTSSSPGSFENLLLMCRKGNPKILVTGTPKPTRFVNYLRDKADLIIRGSSYDNRANLADAWFESVVTPLAGTTLGRQEINGEILDAIDGALWVRDWVQVSVEPPPQMRTIRLGWDPAITSHAKSDEHGIIVAGIALDGSTWVLEDGSGVLGPLAAASRVLQLSIKWGVSLVAVEGNQGGDVWQTLLTQAAKELGYAQHQTPRVKKVTSSTSKEARAQPIAFIYESKSYAVWHVPGLDELEIEMMTWVPKESSDSPNRVDALVLAIDALGHVTGTRSVGMAARSQASPNGGTRRTSRRSMAAVMTKQRNGTTRRIGR